MEYKLKVSLYIRGKQSLESNSLENQEKELRVFCAKQNYIIHEIYIDQDMSALDKTRPGYRKLITDIKEKKIQAVIVKKVDRLFRSMLDFEEFIKIAQENNVMFISLRENFDTTTMMGKAMLRIVSVFAQLEREAFNNIKGEN